MTHHVDKLCVSLRSLVVSGLFVFISVVLSPPLSRRRCFVKQPSTLGSSRTNSEGSSLWRCRAAGATTQPSEPTGSSPKSE